MLRASIVGLGSWARVILRSMPEHSESIRFTSAVVRRPESVAPAVQEYGFDVTTSYEQMLADPNIDAVVLCTPHGQHAGQILAAARAGKHVFCEKPLTMTRADAVAAVEACRAHGVVLAVGHERRFEPPIMDLKAAMDEGLLGKPMHIEANFSHDILTRERADSWRLDAEDAPAAGLTGPAIHMLDRAISLFGKIESLYAQCVKVGSDMPQGDTLSVLLKFTGGQTAYVGSLIATPFLSRFQLFGSQASVEIKDKAWVDKPAGWSVEWRRCNEDPETRSYPPATPIFANLEAFASAITHGTPYPIPAEQQIETVACIEAVSRSLRSGGPVSL